MKAIRFFDVPQDPWIKKYRGSKKAGPLEEFYTICKKLTKDTMGMGNWINLGAQNIPGKSLMANGGHLPRYARFRQLQK